MSAGAVVRVCECGSTSCPTMVWLRGPENCTFMRSVDHSMGDTQKEKRLESTKWGVYCRSRTVRIAKVRGEDRERQRNVLEWIIGVYTCTAQFHTRGCPHQSKAMHTGTHTHAHTNTVCAQYKCMMELRSALQGKANAGVTQRGL